MLKQTSLACLIFASSSTLVFAQATPYVGVSLGATYSQYRSNLVGNGFLFGGYSTTIGNEQNIYLAGELQAGMTVSKYNQHAYRIGASFIPGLKLTPSTMVYTRVGVINSTSFHSSSASKFGAQYGVGVQTDVSQNWSVRSEVVHLTSMPENQFNVGLVYKLG